MADEHAIKAQKVRDEIWGLPPDMTANVIADALREAGAAERKRAADIAREQQNYWNTVAYDKRQAGKDDNFACSSAQAAWEIAAAIEGD
jgi:hypothetical protein